MNKKYINLNKFSSLLFYFSIFIFMIAFNFQHNPPPPWYQQFMPDLNNRPISDITFTDSLTGYAVTGDGTVGDTNYILKTENGGDNWNVIHTVYRDLSRVIFLNNMTGYVSGGFNVASQSYLVKTTDGGNSWNLMNTPSALTIRDMSIISESQIWIITEYFGFNVFRTTNGGNSWELQFESGSSLRKIYFHDDKLGFLGSNSFLWRTTNSGTNWNEIPGQNGFRDMYFADSLIGWKSNPYMYDTLRKTIDGGLNWSNIDVPRQGNVYGGNISNFSSVIEFDNINKDSIWSAGGYLTYSDGRKRGILFFSSNGGSNWLIQVPDTSFSFQLFSQIQFVNKKIGWSYLGNFGGIHTTIGGDTTFISNIKNLNSEYLTQFQLYQNYPNPFNPLTKIKIDIPKTGEVKLILYDILGRQIAILINEKLSTGSYEYTLDGSSFTSGVYFYSLITENAILTKKMLLLR